MKSSSSAFVLVGPLQQVTQQHPARRVFHEAPVQPGVVHPDAVEVIRVEVAGGKLTANLEEHQLQASFIKSQRG